MDVLRKFATSLLGLEAQLKGMVIYMKEIIKNNLLMLKYIARYCPSHICITLINSILSSVTPIFYILFTRYIINSITNHVDILMISLILLAYLLFNISYSFFNTWLQQCIIPKNTQTLNKKMQTMIFNKSLELDLDCYEDMDFYNKFSIALQQSDTRALAVLNTFSTLIGNLFGVASLSTLISSFEPILLVLVVANVAITFAINTKTINIQHKYYEDKIPSQRECEYAKRVIYQREYAKEFRLFNEFSDVIMDNYNNAIDKLLKLIRKYGKKLSKYSRVQGALSAIFNSLIMSYLIYKVIIRSLSIGDFIALIGSSQQLASQLSQIINVFPQMYEHSIYINNFEEFMNYKPHIAKDISKIPAEKESTIELKDVSFAYPNTSKAVLQNVNLKIYPDEKVAFVGCNGAGKSTLIKLIAHLYDPSEGKVMLNNIDYNNYNITSLRNNIGIIFQDYQSFSVSIAENVLMRPIKNHKEDEKIVNNALKYVGLYDKVHSLDNGIYTVLSREFNNSGTFFSGGEFQKLAIARIYVKKCNIVILDEPSSALDPFSENDIFTSVLDFAKDKTVILISHRLTNVKNVDKIFFFENGLLLESGSHEELMRLNGKYAEMYKIQANNYITLDGIKLDFA